MEFGYTLGITLFIMGAVFLRSSLFLNKIMESEQQARFCFAIS